MTVFILDNIEMNTGLKDVNGAQWYITDTSGWFDAPDMRQTIIDRSLGHGSIVASSFMDKRRILLTGVCKVTGTEDNFWRSRDRLLAAVTTFSAAKMLTVSEYGTTKQLAYWGASGTQIGVSAGSFSFTITLVCENPVKYSPVTTIAPVMASGTAMNISVAGGFPSPAIYSIANIAAGSSTPVLIQNSFGGSTIGTIQIASYAPAAGETNLVIDVMNRTVQGMNAAKGNVVNRYGSLSAASLIWFDLQPGANNTLSYTGVNTTMVPSYKDAWL